MEHVLVVLCVIAGLAITVGAQAVISNHTRDGTAGVATRLQRIEDLEEVRAIPACYGYGHDLIFTLTFPCTESSTLGAGETTLTATIASLANR